VIGKDWPATRWGSRSTWWSTASMPGFPSDRNIAMVANDAAGIYKSSWHVERIRGNFERQGKDPEVFVRFHARRLKRGAALGVWSESMWTTGACPTTSSTGAWPMTSAMAATACASAPSPLSTSNSTSAATERFGSIGSWSPAPAYRSSRPNSAGTWRGPSTGAPERLVETGHAKREADGALILPRNLVATLERQEVARAGQELAKARAN
jgi:hypothetical protein